jgi:hypothetical protein
VFKFGYVPQEPWLIDDERYGIILCLRKNGMTTGIPRL